MLSTYGAPFDVINDVSIDSGPIDCLSCLCLHLLHSLVCAVESARLWSRRDLGDAASVSLQGEYWPQWTAHPRCPRSV